MNYTIPYNSICFVLGLGLGSILVSFYTNFKNRILGIPSSLGHVKYTKLGRSPVYKLYLQLSPQGITCKRIEKFE